MSSHSAETPGLKGKRKGREKGEPHSAATPGLVRQGMSLGEANPAVTQGKGRLTDGMRNNGAKSTL